VATYKLIQDIEAEDKILGPLTLRQFIFGIIAAFFFYLCFFAITKGVYFILIIFAPPAIFFAFFAFPFGRDQPTEIWFLAKLHFWFLPRQRIWDQTGTKELVTITVPKKIEPVLTDGLSQTEVKSRLQALANTIDSRGWVIKNVSTYAQPGMGIGSSDDRLIDFSTMPQEVPDEDPNAVNDILDPNSNSLAYHVGNMVDQSAAQHRQQLMDQLNAPAPTAPAAQPAGWFTSHIDTTPAPVAPAPQLPAADLPNEALLSAQLKHQASSQDAVYGHMRTVQPLGSQPPAPSYIPQPVVAASGRPATPMTTPSDPAILNLAGNDDLNVATLAREAHKAKGNDQPPTDEVVISLR
jgi:hypothetical protein